MVSSGVACAADIVSYLPPKQEDHRNQVDVLITSWKVEILPRLQQAPAYLIICDAKSQCHRDLVLIPVWTYHV